ncbi:ADP-ribose pyrophosphatase [Lentzea flava]|uniref:ADP-ribose pyrophosphatase n=1 Tax=Lentzea flava TaxID=103732 RepID=A0ABQ2UWJ9_9PSEU|nr:NUDIX domain-containing protein [Lentzea flava]GGU53194.1 ADP-ribose pyrophosphatase [Lentzea flava]
MGGESSYVVDLAASDDETHRDRLRGVSRNGSLGTVRGVETLGTRQVYANPWMAVREDEIRRADGTNGIYGVVEKPDFALIIPLDGERVRLVEQYRYPIGMRRWEFPQGTAPDREDSDPVELAARELREETGLRAGRMIELGVLDVAPGMSSQRGRVFLATELTEGFHEREHEEQDMRSAWFPRADLETMIAKSEITDAQSIAAYTLLLLHEHSQP